jgi:hypothetical protein
VEGKGRFTTGREREKEGAVYHRERGRGGLPHGEREGRSSFVGKGGEYAYE